MCKGEANNIVKPLIIQHTYDVENVNFIVRISLKLYNNKNFMLDHNQNPYAHSYTGTCDRDINLGVTYTTLNVSSPLNKQLQTALFYNKLPIFFVCVFGHYIVLFTYPSTPVLLQLYCYDQFYSCTSNFQHQTSQVAQKLRNYLQLSDEHC